MALLDDILHRWSTPFDADDEAEAEFRRFYTDPVTVNGTSMAVTDLLTRARNLQAAISGQHIDIIHRIETPDTIVVGFLMYGRHDGPFASPLGTVPATGVSVASRVTDILTVRDGRVTDIWVISDDLGLLRQMNAISLTEPNAPDQSPS